MAATSVCDKHKNTLKVIENITSKASQIQTTVLQDILTKNKNAQYLQRHGFTGKKVDKETYKRLIPIVTYEDIQEVVKRIVNGDKSPILCCEPITEFYTRFVPRLETGKGLYFLFMKSETRTQGGHLALPSIISYYNSQQFKTQAHDPYNILTSPKEAIYSSNILQSMYVQMLCGLLDRQHVLRIGAFLAPCLLRVIKFLQSNWQELAGDIDSGTLNSKITDTSLKGCMVNILKPSPMTAKFVREECSKENWKGIIPRIWPNTKYIDVILTGAMKHSIAALEYYGGGLPLVSTMYASSECYYGLNLKPMCKPSDVSYRVMPNMAYFEFLPHESGSVSQTTVDLVDVKVGNEYEMVVTTYAGLYRYRLGDILRVTGFHNSAPQFHFVRRKDVFLNINSEETNEVELQRAVDKASQILSHQFHTNVVEYTSCVDANTRPAHYIIYWELLVEDPSNIPTGKALNDCCLAMEECFNSRYRQGRIENSIGPLELRIVQDSTFEKLMDLAVAGGASINIYKVPRCVKLTTMIKEIERRVVSRHFSRSLPRGNL